MAKKVYQCAKCGNNFVGCTWRRDRGISRFCSYSCSHANVRKANKKLAKLFPKYDHEDLLENLEIKE